MASRTFHHSVAAFALLLLPALAAAQSNWPGWRGATGLGHTAEQDLPLEWSADSVNWKAELPGRGQSSPVIWDGRIFLTAQEGDGQTRLVLCLDRADGKLLWQHTAWKGEPESSHHMNGWASATCATDGEIVLAFFGRAGLHAYTVEGKHLWSKDLGEFKGPWGTASCPLLVGDLVVQNGDSEADAFIAAFDKRTGKEVWRTARPNHRGWSSPILIDTGQRRELVINGHAGVRAYDPETGKELWYCKSFNGRGTPTVAYHHGLVYVVNGLQGDVYTIRPGGSGDVTETRMQWHTPRRAGRDLPSPIVVGKYLFVCSMKGIASCYDALTGEELHKTRLPGNFSSSPIAAGGKVYIQNEAGVTYVVQLGPEIEVLATNDLRPSQEEIFRASLTPSDGQLFSRSDRILYCIGAAGQAE